MVHTNYQISETNVTYFIFFALHIQWIERYAYLKNKKKEHG